ncbi:MAG: group 1 glycosyl [Geobacteraceae bacterium]|nr:MAG: group 1 glycosyl [Geobacteraceae bacterium]
MRIALLSFHFAEYALSLAEALSEQHEVLLMLDRKNASCEVGTVCGGHGALTIRYLDNLTFLNPGIFANILTIVREIVRFRPDVIHGQEVFRDYFTPVLPFFRRHPFVLTIHDHKPHSGADSRIGFRERQYKSYLRHRADAVIVHGERIRSETEELSPWLRGKVHAVPHGVLGKPVAEFLPDWEQGLLLFFGRISQYKGLPYLVEAVQLLKSWGIKVRVLVAGTGPALAPLYDRIQGDPAFTLLNEFIPAEKIPELFRRANIVVLPYTDATQSGVAAYAVNYGRPVVASDVGSLREMVFDEHNGLLVPPCNSLELAKSLLRLLTNEKDACRMGRNGFLLGHGEFSWQRIASMTAGVYKSVQGGRKA